MPKDLAAPSEGVQGPVMGLEADSWRKRFSTATPYAPQPSADLTEDRAPVISLQTAGISRRKQEGSTSSASLPKLSAQEITSVPFADRFKRPPPWLTWSSFSAG